MAAGWTASLAGALFGTLLDVLPIVTIMLVFQLLVLRRPIPNLKRVAVGFGYVVAGLALFLVGLERALFPIGRTMAQQLTDPAFLGRGPDDTLDWTDYYWVYLFAAAIGFATTVAEPSLIAVARKAREVSGGAIGEWGLRIAVAKR